MDVSMVKIDHFYVSRTGGGKIAALCDCCPRFIHLNCIKTEGVNLLIMLKHYATCCDSPQPGKRGRKSHGAIYYPVSRCPFSYYFPYREDVIIRGALRHFC
jgi:hypothetical protein